MTIQEMFNKAYVGLASQGFKWCRIHIQPIELGCAAVNRCAYSDGKGNHCAWGWVDLSLNEAQCGTVEELNKQGIGIAATLNEEQLNFAQKLQNSHDDGIIPNIMQSNLVLLALKYNLEIPNITK